MVSIEGLAARVLARLERAGERGLAQSELTTGRDGEGGEAAAALEALRVEGRAILWSRRWYAVDGVRWWPGTFSRRGRAGGVVRRAEGTPRRRRGPRVPDEVFVPERDRAGARQGDFVLVRPVRTPPRRGGGRPGELPTAVVVSVLRRARRRLVAELVPGVDGRGTEVRAWDADQSFDAREVRVEGARELPAGTWVVLELGENRRDGSIPARVHEVLGRLDEAGTDLAVVLRHFEIVEEFPAEALAEAAALPRQPSEADWQGRRDLREQLAITIDGEHARDFDDAIEVRRTREGFLARVHVADVSHYVRPGSAIDREASRRGTSVYFPERAVHMLPGALSEELCSLKPGVERLAMTVEMRFDPDGHRTSCRFSRSVIRSGARLTYRQVEERYRGRAGADDAASRPDVARLLESARRLALRLLERRQERGAIDFLLPEVELRIDEMGAVVHIEQAERLESQRVIEELMIAANEAVAEELDRRLDPEHGAPALYRVHQPPDPEDLEPLARLASALGIEPARLDAEGASVPGELSRMLRAARERGGAGVLEQLTLRAMSRAVYAPSCDGHFALAAPFYCHFTSPIRRYPDLVDHRRLAELLGAPAAGDAGTESPEALARRLSERERVAESAERALRRWKKLRYLESRVGSEWSGTVTGVEDFGAFVMLDELGIDGLISVERLEDDYYEYDAENLQLVGRRRGRRIRLGDAVRARVEAVDPVRRRVDLSLAEAAAGEEGAPKVAPSQTRKRRSVQPRRGRSRSR